jgi:guanosine-3',5'-bis(diphosphate) 3'-pyrophosphohydrolase
MSNLATAIQIASTAHINQLDKGGRPYILHPLHVMNKVSHLGDEYMMAAVMHDLIEDTVIDMDFLIRRRFSQEVLYAIGLLTNDEGLPYMDYIMLLATDPIARAVKIADLEHNMDISRIDGFNSSLLKKYQQAYKYLKQSTKH